MSKAALLLWVVSVLGLCRSALGQDPGGWQQAQQQAQIQAVQRSARAMQQLQLQQSQQLARLPVQTGAEEARKTFAAQQAQVESLARTRRMLGESQRLSRSIIWAFWVGGAGLVVALIVRYRSRMGSNQGNTAGGPVQAVSLSASTATPEELGKALFDSLRRADFNTYRMLFPSTVEIQRLFSLEKAKEYQRQVLEPQTLRAQFVESRGSFPTGAIQFSGMKTTPEVPIGNSGGSSAPMQGIKAASLLVASQGKTIEIPIGSLLHLPSGWKIGSPRRSQPTG